MIRATKTQSLHYGIYDIVHANGKQERRVMNEQQRKGLRKSKAWKNILSCECLAKIEVSIKLKF